jgi:hypothetical protein
MRSEYGPPSSPNELRVQENKKTDNFHKVPMLTSALVVITLIPLQVSPSGKSAIPLNTPLAIAAFVDTAKILGLPKFRLRDSSGNPYLPDKALLQEPLATVHDHAGIIFSSEVNKRKAYIRSYVRR